LTPQPPQDPADRGVRYLTDSEKPTGSSRDRLLAAAADLFYEQGYGHVSLDQILQASGVVRSNFYYHFKGKEDLGLTVIDVWLERLNEKVLTPVEHATLGPLAKARMLLDALITTLESGDCRGGCPFGTMASAESEHNERFRAKLSGVFDGFLTHLETLFAAAAAAGELTPTAPSPADLAAVTLSVVQGGYVLSKTFRDAGTMRTAVTRWIDAVAAG
jgi:TetR/AcrR family transcriptional regulator, transcriptional repressor for nem operon